MIAAITGTALKKQYTGRRMQVGTEYGEVDLIEFEGNLILPRHGIEHQTPPHRINHKAHLKALKKSGVKGVYGFCSTGSLKKNIPPGTYVIAEDYLSLQQDPTYHDETIKHVTPGFSEKLRENLLKACNKTNINPLYEGIYAHLPGPRLETKAEVRMLSQHADLVGMTAGWEATLACELEMEYACLCTVDNWANGVGEETPDYRKISEKAGENIVQTKKIIQQLWRA
ncbi:MAG: hypothetical protein GF334_11715 [Candidatus Altiarchaeales archaeon]|nr:hypothetical protein [Candidatus Altiarchaeales archaeon]